MSTKKQVVLELVNASRVRLGVTYELSEDTYIWKRDMVNTYFKNKTHKVLCRNIEALKFMERK